MSGLPQLAGQGVALGFTYALIALGFVIVYRASSVLNLAQGAMILAGTYTVSWAAVDLGVPFFVAVVLACCVMTAATVAFQRTVLQRVAGSPEFVPIMVTLGAGIAAVAGVELIFGSQPRLLGDPWGASSVDVAGVALNSMKVWTVVVAVAVLAAYFYFDRRTKYGTAIRAAAADEEAAASVGVPVRRLHATVWAMAGILTVIGGVFLAGFPNSPTLSLGDAALRALPAVVVGGLASPPGAVLGGLVIGVVEVLVAGLSPDWMGDNAGSVAPYFVMMAILLVRPYGVFGTAPTVRL